MKSVDTNYNFFKNTLHFLCLFTSLNIYILNVKASDINNETQISEEEFNSVFKGNSNIFDEKDIDIEVSEQNLIIDGKKSDEMNENLIHQGLASRNFNRKFVLSEDMVVQGAALSNGILYIGIQRVIPENKKPKKIPLTSKESLLNS